MSSGTATVYAKEVGLEQQNCKPHEGRQRDAESLWNDDEPQTVLGAHAQRIRTFQLSAGNGLDAATQEFCRVCGGGPDKCQASRDQ